MTDYSSIETVISAKDQATDLASNVWKRFKRHRGAIAGAVIFGILIVITIFAFLSPFDPVQSDLKDKFQAPSVSHSLGTDAVGRDLLTRILYGGRISLAVGGIAIAIAIVIGVPSGA